MFVLLVEYFVFFIDFRSLVGSRTSQIELLTFRRLPTESIDDTICRYEIVRGTAEQLGDFNIGVGAMSWLMLTHIGVPKTFWHTLLFPFGGRLPTTEDELQNLIRQIRQQCHLLEHTHAGPRTLEEGWRQPGGTGTYFSDPADTYTHAFAGESFYMGDAATDDADDGEGYYFGAEADTDTEDEPGELDETEAYEFIGDLAGATLEDLRADYPFCEAALPPHEWPRPAAPQEGQGQG